MSMVNIAKRNKVQISQNKSSEGEISSEEIYYKFITPFKTDLTCIVPVATSKNTVRP